MSQLPQKLLVERGTDVSAAKSNGTTPLHDASWNGHLEVARLLVELGADVSAAKQDGTTPLHDAVRNRHQQVAKLLAERGANLYCFRAKRDTTGLSPKLWTPYGSPAPNCY